MICDELSKSVCFRRMALQPPFLPVAPVHLLSFSAVTSSRFRSTARVAASKSTGDELSISFNCWVFPSRNRHRAGCGRFLPDCGHGDAAGGDKDSTGECQPDQGQRDYCTN